MQLQHSGASRASPRLRGRAFSFPRCPELLSPAPRTCTRNSGPASTSARTSPSPGKIRQIKQTLCLFVHTFVQIFNIIYLSFDAPARGAPCSRIGWKRGCSAPVRPESTEDSSGRRSRSGARRNIRGRRGPATALGGASCATCVFLPTTQQRPVKLLELPRPFFFVLLFYSLPNHRTIVFQSSFFTVATRSF